MNSREVLYARRISRHDDGSGRKSELKSHDSSPSILHSNTHCPSSLLSTDIFTDFGMRSGADAQWVERVEKRLDEDVKYWTPGRHRWKIEMNV